MVATSLLSRFLPFRRRIPPCRCATCETPLRPGVPENRFQSPLGDGIEGDACHTCRDLRAVGIEHACWFLTLAGEGSERGAKAWMYLAVDAHGAYYGRAVHVLDSGGYVPIGTWAASPAGVARLTRFRDENDVRPGEDSRRPVPRADALASRDVNPT